jgi:hypothetical protein
MRSKSPAHHSLALSEFTIRWQTRYEQYVVFVGARYKQVRIRVCLYTRALSLKHSPRLEQVPNARDLQFPTALGEDLPLLSITVSR